MTEPDELPEAVVFDAEPLIAYFCDEPGSDAVQTYLRAVEGTVDGYCSAVNLAEVHYVVRSIAGEQRADVVVDTLTESGVRRVDTRETWRLAAEFKAEHAPSLGDAFALATAAHVEGTLVVGADDDFESIEGVRTDRIRTDGV